MFFAHAFVKCVLQCKQLMGIFFPEIAPRIGSGAAPQQMQLPTPASTAGMKTDRCLRVNAAKIIIQNWGGKTIGLLSCMRRGTAEEENFIH